MHAGGFGSPAEVVGFYDDGGPGAPGQDPRIRPLGLSAGERADLEAVLRGLTGAGLDCLVAEARSAPPDKH